MSCVGPLLAIDSAGWRADELIAATVAAERVGYVAVIVGDAGAGWPDPITVLTAAAPRTTAIRLVPQVDTAGEHPYATCRRLVALDKLSGGRVGWCPTDENPQRRAEYVSIMLALWDSWEPEAVVADTAAGSRVDPSTAGRVDIDGDFYSVHSAVDVGGSPFGHPLLLDEDVAAHMACREEVADLVGIASR